MMNSAASCFSAPFLLHLHLLFVLLLPLCAVLVHGYGAMGPIAAAFGADGFFCAITAGGAQQIICWHKNNASIPSTPYSNSLPAMAALSGGDGFLCGIMSNTSQAYCWNWGSINSGGANLVPSSYLYNTYAHIAAGKSHVCAVRGLYYSDGSFGNVDCWEFKHSLDHYTDVLVPSYGSSFVDSSISSLAFRQIVSGDGFSCGLVDAQGVICWGPKSANMSVSDEFEALASGEDSVCGIHNVSREIKCWGGGANVSAPVRTRFVGLSAGADHFCGIKEDDHEIQCWGSLNQSVVPRSSGFLSIASSDHTTCGVRELDLVLDCWDVHGSSLPEFTPPLELCSPGLCSPASCGDGEFAFNASTLNEPELSSLCLRRELKVCLPCGSSCSKGFFPSGICSQNADRMCTACSLCQNSSCVGVCGEHTKSGIELLETNAMKKLLLILGPSVSGSILILIACCIVPGMVKNCGGEGDKKRNAFCIGKPVVEAAPDPANLLPTISAASVAETPQIFRLSELKDATHGFKEFNELGRGSYGFVYKAILSDGRQVAVKRANAATIINTSSRDFELELETLCNIRHVNIVNLLGYCVEMGERILVYEYMANGTLSDHLHEELSPLSWDMRLRFALQAASGLEYLHNDVSPPIIHQDVKTSNILLDSEWNARITDFGLLSAGEKDSPLTSTMKNDVWSYGIVLLELLSGRKAYDGDYTPPDIVEWALPLIRRGRAAAIIDRNVALPRNVEPLLKLADIAEVALKENPTDRPSMSQVVTFLDQIVKTGLIM
uniref:non-specific serine/threonine protein kinase n=1 Tax=Kalanchoe fedtschenkoi TaxID=63787 RepID=A0A7N0V716_KALFE